MLRWLVVVGLWACATGSVGGAQEGAAADTPAAKSRPGNCETNSADLDDLRIAALEGPGDDGVIVAIARLGDKETSRTHNRRRLLAVKNYLARYGVPPQKIITEEGEKVSGFGRVELHLDGKLRTLLLAHPNKGLCVECCNPDDKDFYPHRKRKG